MKTAFFVGAAATAFLLSFAVSRAQSVSPAVSVSKPASQTPANPAAIPIPPRHISKEMFQKYDTNKDGVLDAGEIAAFERDHAARHAEKLRKYDTNHDGKLDAQEKAAMRADMAKEKDNKIKDQEKQQ